VVQRQCRGLCWQTVPAKIGKILKHPKAMAARMKMMKFDVATLEAATKKPKRQRPIPTSYGAGCDH
jgi:hypothetical protein